MTDPSSSGEGGAPGAGGGLDINPERIGEWTVLRLLGRGAMAGVWLCQDPSGRRAAVKWLDRAALRNRHRFERELRALAQVQHPHVVQVLGQGEHEGRPYAVMQHVEGSDLRVYGAKLRQRPAAERHREVARLGSQLCEALAAVHDEGLVHRDVKPANVLVDRQGRAVLVDFGVVKDLDEPSGTVVGVLVGTAGYAAPEQLRGEDVDHRADLYGLGATLYFLLTGDRPYAGRDAREVGRSQRSCPVPHPSGVDPQVPPALETAVMRLLAKRPEDRFAHARAARDALGQDASGAAAQPLAGRARYLDAAAASLERVRRGEGRVLHLRGARGSGRSWLMESVEGIAARRGVPVVAARDEQTLTATLGRLSRGEALGLVTRLPLSAPPGVPVDTVELEPLSIAEVRRSLVSSAPRTAEPHRAAERLFRATGGHAATLLALLERHTQDGALNLPAVLEAPAGLHAATEALSWEAGEVLGALALVDRPLSASQLEPVVQFPVDDALAELVEAGLVARQAGLWSTAGELVGALARELLPDPEGVQRRIDASLAAIAGGPGPGEAEGPAQTEPSLGAALDEAEVLCAQGRLDAARLRVEQVQAAARGLRSRDPEPRAMRLHGLTLLDGGEPRLAEARFADAVALARALDQPGERRAAHILRAAATLDARPGSQTAAAVAMDRLHRAMNTLDGPDNEGYRALGHALMAICHALLGDRRSAQAAILLAEAGLDGLAPTLRLRVRLRLAQALTALGQRAQADAVRAECLVEARTQGWGQLARLCAVPVTL